MNKLALGTVQFGVDYGVNQSGQTPIKEVENILQIASNAGIDTIDTAPTYGNSEQVLGGVLTQDNWKIITKTTALNDDIFPVSENFHQSLRQLKVSSVYGLLFHRFDDVYNRNFRDLYDCFLMEKQYGTVKKLGFSVYTPEQIDFLLESYDFDIIQVPINVFDQRLIQNRQLKELKKRGVEIHARSIFLQGLLLNNTPQQDYFKPWKNNFNQYFTQLKNNNVSRLSAALNFAMGVEELDRIIIGVNTAQQLTELLNASQKIGNIQYTDFAIDDVNLLNPSLWKL